MPDITITTTEADGQFWMVVTKAGKSERYPAHTLIEAEVMVSQEKRRLGLTPPHLTLDDLRKREAG